MKRVTLKINDPSGSTKGRTGFLYASFFFLFVFIYLIVRSFFTKWVQLPNLPGGTYGKMIPPALFAFFYLTFMRGWKSTVFLLFFLWIYCWAVEELSIHTGFPFGNYYYSDALGYKLDVVPITLGINYFWLLVFPAFFVSNLIAQGSFLEQGNSLGKWLFTSLIAAILISGIDMVVDPLDATRMSEWVWTKNSYTAYYGIPYMNYLGYIIVMTPAFFIYGMVERKVRAKPQGSVSITIASVPLIFYFLIFILYAGPSPSGVLLVACFTMVFPLILATDKLLKYFSFKD